MKSRTITVQFFALLREQAGRTEAAVRTAAATPGQLYAELAAKHAFTLKPAQLKVAVNDDFAPWEQPLEDGDRVVFIPPVAGG